MVIRPTVFIYLTAYSALRVTVHRNSPASAVPSLPLVHSVLALSDSPSLFLARLTVFSRAVRFRCSAARGSDVFSTDFIVIAVSCRPARVAVGPAWLGLAAPSRGITSTTTKLTIDDKTEMLNWRERRRRPHSIRDTSVYRPILLLHLHLVVSIYLFITNRTYIITA